MKGKHRAAGWMGPVLTGQDSGVAVSLMKPGQVDESRLPAVLAMNHVVVLQFVLLNLCEMS